jgi:hypothetical protein
LAAFPVGSTAFSIESTWWRMAAARCAPIDRDRRGLDLDSESIERDAR